MVHAAPGPSGLDAGDAGVRRLLLWMGVGGLDHDVIVRSMRLFAEEVLPHFR